MSVWKNIESLMQKNGISSKKLADIAGVVPSAVTKWKNGSSIRNEALNRIAVHFGVSIDWLLGDGERRVPIQNPAPSLPAVSPVASDLAAEIGQVRSDLASMKAQLETVTRLLGAALGKGLAPDSADLAGHGKRKAG